MDSFNNNTCKVSIDNQEYYIPCDRVQDLDYIDGYLVNVSSQSIVMYPRFDYDVSVYPRINCSSMQPCVIRTQSNYGTQPVTSDYKLVSDMYKTFNFDYVVIFLLFIILGVKLIWKN